LTGSSEMERRRNVTPSGIGQRVEAIDRFSMIFGQGGGYGTRYPSTTLPERRTRIGHVATGLAYPTSATKGDVGWLKKLGLVVQVDGELRLTATGRDRYVKLPSSELLYKASSTDKVDEVLAKFFNSGRR
jgi:hypothetical protein